MALYRKYRPATFAEVVGQEHVTEPLSRALDAGRINHAYLFSGPRGCGKTSSARILARSLNCIHGPTSTPCGQCPSCIALGPGGSGNLDVIELDAASHGGVDDTRDLRDKAFYAPAESRYRVFIIDEAHMVTTAGFNALLKIVEEPPEHLIFIFATTEPEKVLPTIRSRTHHYPFRLLPPAVMRGLLEHITAEEHVQIDDAVYPLVIRAGGGSPRDSLSVLDQLLAGAGADGITYPRALMLLGATDLALIDDAVDALAANDGAALYETVHRVIEAGHDPRRFAGDLLDRVRDLILLQAVPDAGERGLIDAPADVLARMHEEVARIGPATLTRYAEIIHDGLGQMRGATAPRLLLEVMCARMLLPEADEDRAALLQRIERLESGIAPAAPVSAAQQPVATPAAPAQGAAGDADVPQRFVRPSQRAQMQQAEQDRPTEPAATTPPEQPAPAPVTQAVEPPTPPAPTPTTPAPPPQAPAVVAPEPVPAPDGVAAAAPSVPQTAPVEPAVTTPAPVVEAESAPEPVAQESAPPRPTPVPATEQPPASEPGAESAPAVEPEPEPAPAPADGPDAVAVRAAWSEVQAKIRGVSRTLAVMLSDATVRRAEGHVLGLSHKIESLAGRLGEPHHSQVIEQVMGEVFGGKWRLVIVPDTGAAPAGGPPAGGSPGQRPGSDSSERRPQFVRPSQAGRGAGDPDPVDRPGPTDFSTGPVDDPGLPPEPDPYDDPYGEQPPAPAAPAPEPEQTEDEMMAEAAAGGSAGTVERRDPEEVAIELLEAELGARRIDG